MEPLIWQLTAAGPDTAASGPLYAAQITRVMGGWNARVLFRATMETETTAHGSPDAARIAISHTLRAHGLIAPEES